MVRRLFRIFDHYGQFRFFRFSTILVLILLTVIMANWVTSRIESKVVTLFIKSISEEHDSGNHKDNCVVILLRLFILIITINFVGLYPDTFCLTRHFSINLGITILIFFRGLILWLVKNFIGIVSHLCPKGRPLGLRVLLVLVEFISLFIRPLTLIIRLMANIIAGHLIISLVYERVGSVINLIGTSLVGLFLTILERGVSIIQGFIFSLLITLYIRDNIGI